MLTKTLLLGVLASYAAAVKVEDSDGYLSSYGEDDHADDHDDDRHHSYRYGHGHRHPSDGYLSHYGRGRHHHYSHDHHDEEEEEDDHEYYDQESDHDEESDHDDDHHHHYRKKYYNHHYYPHYDYRYGPSAKYISKHYGAGHAHQGDYEPVDVHHEPEAPRGEYEYVPIQDGPVAGPEPVYQEQDLSWLYEDHHYEPIHDESEYGEGEHYYMDPHGNKHAYENYPYGYNPYNGYYYADPWDREIGYNPEHQGTSVNRETDTYGWKNGDFGYGDAYGSNFDPETHDYSDPEAYYNNGYYNYGPRDYYVRNHYNPNFLKHVFDKTFLEDLENTEEEQAGDDHYHAEEEPRYDVPLIREVEAPEYVIHPYQPRHP